MSFHEILIAVMAAFAVAGAIDRIFGNRWGLGKEFEEGILAMGSLALAMVGIVCLAPVLAKAGVFLAAQCCEHLNRAIVLEQAALKPWQQPVNVLPQPHAGGSFATTAWQNMKAPTALEAIEADAGLDIGDTLIGMHLKRVAVPVRLSVRRLGQANLVAARTRPKFIGGARAAYLPEEELR